MAEKVKFDPSKPHGTVHSDTSPIKFFQNGRHFTANGEEYVPPPPPPTPDDIEAEVQRRVNERLHEAEASLDARVKAAVAEALAATAKK